MISTSPDIFNVFNDAVSIESPTEQQRYLEQACGDDSQARARIEALLHAHNAAGGFFGGLDSLETTQAHFSTETLNSVIGRYQLREILGSGGMGIVYAADQESPIRRQVALKVIKPGMDSREVLARFDAERQALALMDHPGIARVFDAGTTDSGHPYFVMELVRGLPITDYCDRYRLSLADRLKLFITVCQAVQHAHLKGIIHRDLKPSNVLVAQQDGFPVPKVIDFGVAKATTHRLTDQTLYTHQAQLLGTPLYMSPEQAELSGVELDARSDVYALGVLLYKLLSGRTPFDQDRLSVVSFDELRRIIRQDAPPRPSQCVSTLPEAQRTHVAKDRSVDERQLRSCLQGDLDWIVMKALAKDRTHRYGSAASLATDVQKYLDHQPVTAGPPSFIDRARWFARPRFLALTGAAILVSMIVLVYTALTSSSPKQNQSTASTALQNESTSQLIVQSQVPPALSDPIAEASEQIEPPPVTKQSTAAASEQDEQTPIPSQQPADIANETPSTIPPLAVFPFEERGSGAKGYGSKISDFLVASLADDPALIIVERAELNKVLDEQKLSASGLVKPDEAVQIGRLTGAKLIVLGSILELDSTLILSARITSTETSRIAGEKVRGKTSDDMAELADKLDEKVLATLTERAGELIPKPMTRVDRLAAIKAAIGEQPLPKVWLQVTEEHVGQATIDPAAETELAKLMEDAGFTVIDHQDGNRKHADVIVEGEAFSEFALRNNDLISVKARVEIKAVRTSTRERIATDRQTEIAVDVAEQVAGKTALQNAAAEIASRLLPKLANAPTD